MLQVYFLGNCLTKARSLILIGRKMKVAIVASLFAKRYVNIKARHEMASKVLTFWQANLIPCGYADQF